MDEMDFIRIRERTDRIEKKLDQLMAFVIPAIEDMTKHLKSARLSTSCAQPSNHKREGKMPRQQPKKKVIITKVEKFDEESLKKDF